MRLMTPLLIAAVILGAQRGPAEAAGSAEPIASAGGPEPVAQGRETLPDIDISPSPNGIVLLPADVPQVFRDVFVRYTKVVAPNGKPIHILAQDGWSEARILKARNVLEHILTDVPGTRYGADKSVVANAMADNRATLTLFNTEPDMRQAFRGPLRRVDLGMQDLRSNESPVEGHEDYMAHRTRDASFEEVLHMVHDYGIKPALPEMQLDLIRITDAAMQRDLWQGRQDDLENEPNEYFAAIYDNYLDLWTVPPTVYEGRPIEAGRIPDGTSHFGGYRALGRAGLRQLDPEGLAILQEFFPPYLTYTPELPPEFTGTFSLEFDPNLRYTAKSQHLKDVTLTGDNDSGLIGNGWDNIFTGNDGDNTLRGNGGKDLLDGGAGTDTAVYAGDAADYGIVRDGDVLRVTDKRVGRDGADVLLNIERLAFADRTVDLSAGGVAQEPVETYQATGVKVGEVTSRSAIVWMRITTDSERNGTGMDLREKGGNVTVPPGVDVAALEGAAPGAPGRVRLRYGEQEDLRGATSTPWTGVTAVTDYAHQFRIDGLQPDTRYYYAADTAGPGGSPRHGTLRGSFRTAPLPEQPADVTFTVVTGMMYADLDHRDGFHIYESMLRVDPSFFVATGDTVYYDNESPRVTDAALARYHWDRMYSLPRHIAFHLRVPGYWEKDDHDVYSDDSYPGMRRERMGDFTFEQGQRIFVQQVPMGERTYRRIRWGKRLEVWLVEGRDFRSANSDPDGPEKTIWGEQQKVWLKRTLLESDADWKVLVSPTPIVGPDRTNKADNHANTAFAHEGDEMRKWFQENLPDNFFVACGDRHWQYHSVHPSSGVHEFSSGPASDEHAGGSPGEDELYHRYHGVRGGFLSVSVSAEGIAFRHHDVYGNVVYEYVSSAAARGQTGSTAN